MATYYIDRKIVNIPDDEANEIRSRQTYITLLKEKCSMFDCLNDEELGRVMRAFIDYALRKIDSLPTLEDRTLNIVLEQLTNVNEQTSYNFVVKSLKMAANGRKGRKNNNLDCQEQDNDTEMEDGHKPTNGYVNAFELSEYKRNQNLCKYQ